MADRSVTIRLRVRSSEFDAAMAKAGTEVKILGATVEDTGKKADGASGGLNKLDKSAQKADKSSHGLLKTVLALSPALVPLVGVAALGATALAGMGGAGFLAFKGIQDEMKAGTDLGKQFTVVIDGLKSDLADLESTAAAGAGKGFLSSLTQVRADMPFITRETKLLSADLGDSADHLTRGLLAGLRTGAPLINQFADDTARAAAAFDHWASGGGGQGFVRFLQQNLPGIEHDLGQIIEAIGHLLNAGAMTGVGIISTISLLAQAINSIPTPVLQVLIPLVTGTYVAFRAWSGISKIIDGATASLSTFGRAGAEASATGLSSAALAGSKLIPVIGGLTAAYFAFKPQVDGVVQSLERMAGIHGVNLGQSTQQFLQSAQSGMPADLKQRGQQNLAQIGTAIAQDNGAIGKNTQALLAQLAAQTQVNKQFDYAGLTVQKYTQYLQGNSKGLNKTQLDAASFADAQILGANSSKEARQALADQLQTQQALTAAYIKQNPEVVGQAAALGTSVSALQAAREAQEKTRAAAAAATLQMQLEGDTAGLLAQALQGVSAQGLSVAEAQTRLAASMLATTKALKENGDTVALNTDKGIANRQAIEGSAEALRSQIQAQAAAGASTDEVTASYNTSRDALLQQIAQIYGANSAAYTYAAQVTDLSTTLSSLPPTVNVGFTFDEGKIRRFLDLLGEIPATAPTEVIGGIRIAVPGSYTGGAVGLATGGAPGMAYAGAVTGSGTGRSDTAGYYRLSHGEHVWPAAEVDSVGGQAGMYALRAAIRQGRLTPVSSSRQPPVSAASIAQAVAAALAQQPHGALTGVLTADTRSISALVSQETARGLR